MKCTNCGTEYKDDTDNLFCTKCGIKLPPKDVPVTEIRENIKCTNCGAEYKEDTGNLFCPKCGSKLPQKDVPITEIKENTIEKKNIIYPILKKYIGAVIVLIIGLSPFWKMFNFPEIESVADILGVRLNTNFSFFDAAELLGDITSICEDLYIHIDNSDETFINVFMAVCTVFYAVGLIFAAANIIVLKFVKSPKAKIRFWRFARLVCIFTFIGNYLICKMIDAVREYLSDYVLRYIFRNDVPITGKPFFYLIQLTAVALFLTSFIMVSRIKKQQTLNAYNP